MYVKLLFHVNHNYVYLSIACRFRFQDCDPHGSHGFS